jgi:hypothetical protein
MTAAWAAVAVAAATVVANVAGVWWAGRTQRRLARDDRLMAREIEVYVDLLRWVREIESPKRYSTWEEVNRATQVTDDLDARVTALANARVRRRVSEVRIAWMKFHSRVARDEEHIRKVFEHFATGFFDEQDLMDMPELLDAVAATSRVEEAVREVTAPDARSRPAGAP